MEDVQKGRVNNCGWHPGRIKANESGTNSEWGHVWGKKAKKKKKINKNDDIYSIVFYFLIVSSIK